MSLGTIIVGMAVVVLVALVVLGRLRGVEIHRRTRDQEFARGKELRVVRDVSVAECPWLDRDVGAGTVLFEYLGPTYGLKQHEDLVFVSFDGGTPFFQLPLNSLAELDRTSADLT